MPRVARVALEGYNAKEDTDPRHYSLFSDQDNVLIKEQSRGTQEIDNNQTVNIAHNLGYAPHFYVYGEMASGRQRMINLYQIFSGSWSVISDSTNLTIKNVTGTDNLDAKYFIFYDNIQDE